MEFDGLRFRSEEHQRRFEAIKDWSFLKERRVQLREGEYTEFQEEIARRQWTQLAAPMAKYDPEITMEFYANAWPMEEGVRDKCSVLVASVDPGRRTTMRVQLEEEPGLKI